MTPRQNHRMWMSEYIITLLRTPYYVLLGFLALIRRILRSTADGNAADSARSLVEGGIGLINYAIDCILWRLRSTS
ncbi:hypothetical protein BDV28DRAFT_58546 [Aspergillus coremiiformis]|uniref:Uncharacterized protein n=1 Tax=Aspergillus coremiiformis TaxID=138285 RepID=A0A5N6Z0W3_9EURO|nr:hypothetical protein BDV28DRAFT_58546 [Aspergillus coremiiformis]